MRLREHMEANEAKRNERTMQYHSVRVFTISWRALAAIVLLAFAIVQASGHAPWQ